MARKIQRLLVSMFWTLTFVWGGWPPAQALGAQAPRVSTAVVTEAEPAVSVAPGTPAEARALDDPRGLSWQWLSAPQQVAYDRIVGCIADRSYRASVPNVSKEDLDVAFNAVRHDHPEHWWLGRYALSANGAGGYEVWPITADVAPEEVSTVDARLDAVVREFLSTLPKRSTPYERMRAAYEWVILHTVYDFDASHGQDARGPLVDGKSVCAGYAAAFAYLCREAGVPCTVVTGKVCGSGGHAWNIVELDGTLTYVDPTWGDPIRVDGDAKGQQTSISYDYLCLTSDEMLRDRVSCEPKSLPTFTNRAFDYYALRGALFDRYTADAVRGVVGAAHDAGARQAGVKFNSREEFDAACSAMRSGELALHSIVGSSVSFSTNEAIYTIRVSW